MQSNIESSLTVPVCNSRLSAGDFDIWPSVLHAAAVSLVCTVTLATVTAATDSCCLMVKVVLQLLLLSLEGRYYRLMLEAAVPAAAASTAGNATHGADEAAAATPAFEAVLAARRGRFGLLAGRSIKFRSVMLYFIKSRSLVLQRIVLFSSAYATQKSKLRLKYFSKSVPNLSRKIVQDRQKTEI